MNESLIHVWLGILFYTGILTSQLIPPNKILCHISSSATQTRLARYMLLFMRVTLVTARDRYECVWRDVLAASFQDIFSEEEEELLFIRCGCPEMLANPVLSFAFHAAGGRGGGAAHLKFSHPAPRFKEQSPSRFAGAQKGIQSHPL